LHNAGPIREDGSDKFFGLENFGNTCYCNSIVQALYHSEQFREHVVNYPLPQPGDHPNGTRQKVNVTIRSPAQVDTNGAAPGPNKPRQSFSGGQLAPPVPPLRPEDKPDSPEYKKKQAMVKGPVLELAEENKDLSGIEECTFTGLRDIFTTFIDSQSRTGVLSPQRFLDIFKRNNEMFRNSMHQDAHEFYGIVLNDVIANVEANAKRMQEQAESRNENGPSQITDTALSKAGSGAVTRASGTGWVHDIFEGVLTSETRCLTCETASQRDETFLDLSIDLEEHSSVTACLQSFSAEEMLCERNKFHCDHCGGLQEAEKRMKVKKLPKVLALHLKRFKYTEDYSRLQKLFHRVVYPYHLRMFNTTDDAEDPDRMYELYAVVVHIGGNAYHGHYVAVIKTKDRGWLLFDDEMVEPVDKNFVRNFFGDKPGMACAYVLFYQETTFEKVREEMDAEGVDQVKLAAQAADLATATEAASGSSQVMLSKLNSQPLPAVDENETLVALDQTKSAPTDIDSTTPSGPLPPPLSSSEIHPLVAAPPTGSAVTTEADKAATSPPKSKDQIAREKKELKAQEKAEEKARKAAEKEQMRAAAKERLEAQQKMRETARLEREQFHKAIQESKQMAAEEERRQKKEGAATADTATSSDAGGSDENHWNGFLNRTTRTSKSMARKSMTRKSFAFLHIGQNKDEGKSSDAKADKTDRGETNGENRFDKGETSAGGGENAAPHYQNGSSNSIGPAGKHTHLLPRSMPRSETAPGAIAQLPNHGNHDKEKDKEKETQKPPLKERFTFGLGKKKSSKFLSSS
jgi:ubiquitin carboxyl-terminal hydrolase 9/13